MILSLLVFELLSLSDEAPHNNFNRFERLVSIVFSDIFDFGNIDDEKKNVMRYKYIYYFIYYSYR